VARLYTVSLLFVAGCSASSQSTGLDPGSHVVDLAPSQQGALCDWIAGQYGGYGKTVNCTNDGSETGPTSQADCVSELAQFSTAQASCTATVGAFEDCESWEIATACSKSPGPPPGSCAAVTVAACSGGVDGGAD
jgi:hypothetical protein